MKIVAIIQARMTSSRLKGKVFLKLGDQRVIEHVYSRLNRSKLIQKVVVATTRDSEDDVILDWAKKNRIESFRGEKEDVLSRFYECAIKYNADAVVRVTSDNPLIDPQIVDQTISLFIKSKADYTSNNLKKSYPWGMDVEVISFGSLSQAWKDAVKKSDREHVTQFIRSQPDQFYLTNLEAIDKNHDIRITLDDKNDYFLLKKIFETLGDDAMYEDIINLFNDQPELYLINKETCLLHKKYNTSLDII